ncbi:MAG TPA: host attachment protein [Ideonella sp.]|uniref:host attachment protein n=1 Tax=Ideonella sp. TaxID=1929293 RepID=UPI002E367A8C|nr:host attachment protein [Ideonella sp.]HEX5687388.1 host attachment protein [Ideonella sp.]
MTQATRHPPTLPQWVLVANAARARCFERDAASTRLREVAGFVHEQSRLKAGQLGADRPGHALKGSASTQFEPHTDVHGKHRTQFARELAAYLDEAALAHRYDKLALIASNPFLGELRAQLGDASRRCVVVSQVHDLTELSGRELEERITSAMQGHGV